MKIRRRWHFVFLICAATLHHTASAAPRLNSLTRPIGTGTLSMTYDFQRSDEFFASNGSLVGTPQSYDDHTWWLNFDYGLTDQFTFQLQAPLRYRVEDQLLNADDFGIGDARVSFLYSFVASQNKNAELAAITTIKFPSGDSDIQLLNLAGSVDHELPLGSGQYDWLGGLQGQLRWQNFQLRGEVDFVYRFEDTVDYVQVFTPTQAVGNAEVSYGHELHFKLLAEYLLANRLLLGVQSQLRQVFPGSAETFAISTTGITKSNTRLPAGYELSVTPQFTVYLFDNWRLGAAASIPLAGDDQPIVPLVESLIGIHYMVTIGYAY